MQGQVYRHSLKIKFGCQFGVTVRIRFTLVIDAKNCIKKHLKIMSPIRICIEFNFDLAPYCVLYSYVKFILVHKTF